MTIGTRLFTWFQGRAVGTDPAGNIYYEERRARRGARLRRWVMYAGQAEASAVPPEWHGWLHYTTDAPIPLSARRAWMRPPGSTWSVCCGRKRARRRRGIP